MDPNHLGAILSGVMPQMNANSLFQLWLGGRPQARPGMQPIQPSQAAPAVGASAVTQQPGFNPNAMYSDILRTFDPSTLTSES